MAFLGILAAENRPKCTDFPSVAGCRKPLEGHFLHLLPNTSKACSNTQPLHLQLPEWLPEPEPVITPKFSELGVRPVRWPGLQAPRLDERQSDGQLSHLETAQTPAR
jgi:hypothetical protein